jgi:hypothetical protein
MGGESWALKDLMLHLLYEVVQMNFQGALNVSVNLTPSSQDFRTVA